LNFIFISNDENKNILANITKRVYLEETLYKIINDLINSNENLKFNLFDIIYGKKINKKIYFVNKKIENINLKK